MKPHIIKQALAGLAFGALVAAAPVVQAATTINATGFSLSFVDGNYPDQFDMTLLSDSGGTVRIALHWAEPQAGALVLSEYHDDVLHDAASTLSQLAVGVLANYSITSLALSSHYNGMLSPGVATCGGFCGVEAGFARNSGYIDWTLTQAGQATVLPGAKVIDLNGATSLSQQATGPYSGNFMLDMTSHVTAEARATVGHVSGDEFSFDVQYPSSAQMNMNNVILTAHVAAVPEPAAWATLAAGLALAGIASRRRGRRAVPPLAWRRHSRALRGRIGKSWPSRHCREGPFGL